MVDMNFYYPTFNDTVTTEIPKNIKQCTFNIIAPKSCQYYFVIIPVATNTDHLRKTMHYRYD